MDSHTDASQDFVSRYRIATLVLRLGVNRCGLPVVVERLWRFTRVLSHSERMVSLWKLDEFISTPMFWITVAT